ncbi:hypothetical protein EYF80_035540 [Liparis tanakae]|uniref:Uncharacterized protein n=1 Tax=Liparis tanakae TaxID=230148 RepID=A0A4Z2GLY6_9TELE|nr:hypothetical protein EYF80_035540 [Liparis tanakae]
MTYCLGAPHPQGPRAARDAGCVMIAALKHETRQQSAVVEDGPEPGKPPLVSVLPGHQQASSPRALSGTQHVGHGQPIISLIFFSVSRQSTRICSRDSGWSESSRLKPSMPSSNWWGWWKSSTLDNSGALLLSLPLANRLEKSVSVSRFRAARSFKELTKRLLSSRLLFFCKNPKRVQEERGWGTVDGEHRRNLKSSNLGEEEGWEWEEEGGGGSPIPTSQFNPLLWIIQYVTALLSSIGSTSNECLQGKGNEMDNKGTQNKAEKGKTQTRKYED